MLVALVTALACAPVYWLVVPVRWRREVLSVASLAALAAYDWRLPPLLLAFAGGLFGLARAVAANAGRRQTALLVAGLCLLAALFVANKLGGGSGFGALPTQSALVFLGVSFLVVKAAAVLVDTARGTAGTFGIRELLAWILFLPTYPSGPIEEFAHFRRQWPTYDQQRVFTGLERILFGLVKAVLVAHYLGVWMEPIVAAPAEHGRLALLGGLYACALRFYFDLAGYSDIAIGLGAVFGYEIQENFNWPLLQRNLTHLWQRWHMTLTGWLRVYVFTPVTRGLMRRLGGRGDRLAIAVGQLTAMTLIGLWHGLRWNFLVFGVLQGLGLIWVGVLARDAGRRLPDGLVAWWRRSPIGYACSMALTVTFFSATTLFVVTDVEPALEYLARLAGW